MALISELPTLVAGRKYKFIMARTVSKRGTVLEYYPRGLFYLVQFKGYKECISQKDLLVGLVKVV